VAAGVSRGSTAVAGQRKRYTPVQLPDRRAQRQRHRAIERDYLVGQNARAAV
jgi:hypothetical protein